MIVGFLYLFFMSTGASAQVIHPQWGEQGIVFYERVETAAHIWLLAPDATKLRKLSADNGYYNANPNWSPDGSKVAYASGRPHMRGQWDIVVLDLATGQETMITNDAQREMHTSWSPDGKWIAFVRMTDGGSDIYRIRPDGTDLQQLTKTEGREFHVKWGSDSKHITFDGAAEIAGQPQDDQMHAIYVLNVENGVRTEVAVGTRDKRLSAPTFSPDMKRVVYSGMKDGHEAIFASSHGDQEAEVLYKMPAGFSGGAAYFSPDGNDLAFHMQDPQKGWGLYVYRLGADAAEILIRPDLGVAR
jgi:Tol biopolymer transport system component